MKCNLRIPCAASFFLAESPVFVENEGMPWWVWLILALMFTFLVWWWLRKPTEPEFANPFPEIELKGKGLAKTDAQPAAAAEKSLLKILKIEITPQPVTAEASITQEMQGIIEEVVPVGSHQFISLEDLTIIEGIGPKINSLLHSAGINSLDHLADCDVSRLKAILAGAGLRLADPSSWPEQAKLAASGDLDTLADLKSSLKGGRRN
jgi:predicted flap endonuclease-1-like 5' DNA nuclease